MDEQKKDQVNFKDTLNLPRTDMPIRIDAATTDAQMLARWQAEDLYRHAMEVNKGNRQFVLHDGPPFVNGPIHAGHAYNKILKDMVCKSERMAGAHAPVTPGWDCHGLPIELKVAQEHPKASRSELIAHCRAVAAHWIAVQCQQFKQLGVVMDWDHSYATMDPAYESAILRALAIFIDQNYVERKNKTVPWCASCRTSLAAAEIEYRDRTDPSLYVLFPLEQDAVEKLGLHGPVNLLVWTTTPWTLPLNRAVVIKPGTDYSVFVVNDVQVLVASACVSRIAKELDVEVRVVATIKSDDLVGLRVQHPVVADVLVPVIADAYVALDEGTACVHCAPGCGQQDYEVALKHKLEVYSPLTDDGRYSAHVVPAQLAGVKIADAQIWVAEHLKKTGRLLREATINHAYPHCWRCHKGLIFRATTQWFINLERAGLREKSVAALDKIQFLPEASKNHLKAAIEGRLEWCISRQRVWGVPIPALLCINCNGAFTNKEFVERVADGVAREGIEFWDKVDIEKLLSHNAPCSHCGSSSWRKETDILDVWLDSGVSHWAVLTLGAATGVQPGAPLSECATGVPADFYAEARDQARGWFQSSLLTSMILHNKPCARAILTHGYTVDAQGQKMSKSLGNVISPDQLRQELGTDGLRLWVASIDYENDLVISPVLLAHVKEVYRKIRNTMRFLLSNLYDFDSTRDQLEFNELMSLDQYFMQRLYELDQQIRAGYAERKFTSVFHALSDFCATDLSALYIEMMRDRLYASAPNSRQRRSAQNVLWRILDSITRLMAPILSFTAEQVSDYYQRDKNGSIHLQQFAHVESCFDALCKNADETECADVWRTQWERLFVAREAILKAIEREREKGLIKGSVEARVILALGSTDAVDPLRKIFERLSSSGQSAQDFLHEFLVVSQVELRAAPDQLEPTSFDGLFVKVERALGEKCPRCWQYSQEVLAHNLCPRCHAIANKT